MLKEAKRPKGKWIYNYIHAPAVPSGDGFSKMKHEFLIDFGNIAMYFGNQIKKSVLLHKVETYNHGRNQQKTCQCIFDEKINIFFTQSCWKNKGFISS